MKKVMHGCKFHALVICFEKQRHCFDDKYVYPVGFTDGNLTDSSAYSNIRCQRLLMVNQSEPAD